jgi:uncharacterized protein (DUF1697 family)
VIYVALLRGINVGGKNKVDMKQLKDVFSDAGMTRVATYINSGNVVFSSRGRNQTRIAARLEKAIEAHFGFAIKVLVRDLDGMRGTVAAIEPGWVNDKSMKCDVLFLWEDADRAEVVDELTIQSGIDDVRYVPGAVIWHVDAGKVTRSGLAKLAGTPLYKQVTIRNCNTTRKLLELMEAADGGPTRSA